MNNNISKNIFRLKFEIFISNIQLIFIIIISGIIFYTVDGVIWTIILLFLAFCILVGKFDELIKQIDTYNKEVDNYNLSEENLEENNNKIEKFKSKNTITKDIEPLKNDKIPKKTENLQETITKNIAEINNFHETQSDDENYKENNKEIYYCDICGRMLTEEEYTEYICYCEDCYLDINVDYQINGLTDYNKPFIDAIDAPDAYKDLFNDDLFNEDLLNEGLLDDDLISNYNFDDNNFDEF